jgi:hypothetical protein
MFPHLEARGTSTTPIVPPLPSRFLRRAPAPRCQMTMREEIQAKTSRSSASRRAARVFISHKGVVLSPEGKVWSRLSSALLRGGPVQINMTVPRPGVPRAGVKTLILKAAQLICGLVSADGYKSRYTSFFVPMGRLDVLNVDDIYIVPTPKGVSPAGPLLEISGKSRGSASMAAKRGTARPHPFQPLLWRSGDSGRWSVFRLSSHCLKPDLWGRWRNWALWN